MTDEVEMALKYAKERKMRIQLTERLYSLMYALVPFMGSSWELVHGTLEPDPQIMADSMKALTKWSGEVETSLMVNMFWPVTGEEPFFSEDDLRKNCALRDMPDHKMEAMRDVLAAACKHVTAEWNNKAHEFGAMTAKAISAQHQRDIFDQAKTRSKELKLDPESFMREKTTLN